MQALWRDLLCVGFAKQLWKVYVHETPKVCPSFCTSFCMLPHYELLSRSDLTQACWSLGSTSHAMGAHIVRHSDKMS